MNPTTPGSETSEFNITKYAMTAGAVIDGVAVALEALKTVFPHAGWLSVALAVCGTLLMLASALGYQKGRTALKMASLAAEAAKAPDAPRNP